MDEVNPLWIWLLALLPIFALIVLYELVYTVWPALHRRLLEWQDTRRVIRRLRRHRHLRLSRSPYRYRHRPPIPTLPLHDAQPGRPPSTASSGPSQTSSTSSGARAAAGRDSSERTAS